MARAAAYLYEAWRRDYNEERSHSKLGWMTPQEFAFAAAQMAAE